MMTSGLRPSVASSIAPTLRVRMSLSKNGTPGQFF